MGAYQILKQLKNTILPDKIAKRRVMFGLSRGNYLSLNLRYQLRLQVGFYEMELINPLKQIINPGDICFDIGSHVGYHTLGLARLCKPGRVIGFEPDPALFNRLQLAVEWNHAYAGQVLLYPYAISDRDSSGSVFRLDTLIQRKVVPPPRLIKMDIEGGEFAALQGADHTISKYSPSWVIEVHSRELEDECMALLQNHNYEILVIRTQSWLPETRPTSTGWIIATHLPHNRLAS